MEIEQDYGERMTPIQKLISNERLTYLPNLYYQLYRSIQKLSLLRSQFPQQKILVQRQPTKHDLLIQHAKQQQFAFRQNIKYKKAVLYQLAKSAKEEVIKRNLKKQEKYLFHRVVFSHLTEMAADRIQGEIEKIPVVSNTEEKDHSNEKKIQNHHENNDIFIENPLENGQEDLPSNDLLDDILNENNPEPEQNINQDTPKIENISAYINLLAAKYDKQMTESSRPINRKQCMKKINENLRKRIKNKISDDTQQRNLNSATVLITNLISQQNDLNSPSDALEVPSTIEYLTTTEAKPKRKKEEAFELKWDEENTEKFMQINPKFDSSKNKFGSNYLLLTMEKKEYESYFDKNIQSKLMFPSNINRIPEVSKRFSRKYYYNSIVDPEYQNFVMKHNKKKVFEKFRKISNFVLENSYHHDIEGNSNINMAKMFLTNEGPMSDRVIYKINNNRTFSASSLPTKSLLTRAELSQLSFLVRKYMGFFGSNWKIISLFVSTHPTFSNMFLSPQQIQQFSQICKNKSSESSFQSMETFLEKTLPFSVYSSSIVTPYSKLKESMKLETIDEEITEEKVLQSEPNESQNTIDLNNYESLLNEPLLIHENQYEYEFKNTEKDYQKFCNDIKFPGQIDYCEEMRDSLLDGVENVLSEFEENHAPVLLSQPENKDLTKVNWIHTEINEKLKAEIKIGHPIRKRKNINEKSSELVKILHALKQKTATPGQPTSQKPAQNPNVPTGSTAKPIPSSNTPGPQTSQIKKVLPKKPEEKDSTKEKEKKQSKTGGHKGTVKRKKKDKDQDK